MTFLAIGQDNDVWKVESGGATLTGAILDSRTDDAGHPIMVKVSTVWIPWIKVTAMENVSEQNRRRT